MTPNQRVVQVVRDALAAGPMGDKQRGNFYRQFISCGFSPAIRGGGDIGTVRTSCAIFVRACLHWAGRPSTRVHVPGEPMFNGWLEGMSSRSAAWVPGKKVLSGEVIPRPGDVFYVASNLTTATNGHVGIFLEEPRPEEWVVAAGGGGSGTTCRIGDTPRALGPEFDGMRRPLQGIWRVDELDGWVSECERPTMPSPDFVNTEAPTIPARPRTLKLTMPRMTGDDVKAWQTVIGTKADGVFGPQTDRLTVDWQRAHGLVADGVVGPATRAKAGL